MLINTRICWSSQDIARLQKTWKKKLEKKGCDWLIANKVSKDTHNMGGDNNEVFLIKEKKIIHYKKSGKRKVAKIRIAYIKNT